MNDQPIKLITVRQPWASFLVLGLKPVENRDRTNHYRGLLGILAGKAIDRGPRALEAMDRYLPGTTLESLPRGAVIGTTELYGVTQAMESWWFTGPHGWLVRAPRMFLTPIPARGQLAVINAPPDVRDRMIGMIDAGLFRTPPAN
jgi:hypothetical protein